MALSLGASVLFYGAHHDDWAGDAYPDCSIEFVNAMNLAITQGTAGQLHMEAPFVSWSKADIVNAVLSWTFPTSLRGAATRAASVRAANAHMHRPQPRISRPTACATRCSTNWTPKGRALPLEGAPSAARRPFTQQSRTHTTLAALPAALPKENL